MRKNISWCVLLLLCVVVACSKDEKIPTLLASEQLKVMLPYNNGQVVRFTSNQGRTVDAVVAVKKGTIKKSSCNGCDEFVYEEYVETKFTVGSKTFVQMSIDNRPNVFMSIYSPEDNFSVGAGFDFVTIEGTSMPSCTAPRQSCVDSLTLNGQLYPKLLEIYSGANSDNQLTKAWYTPSRGLVGFAYGNGITYKLNQ